MNDKQREAMERANEWVRNWSPVEEPAEMRVPTLLERISAKLTTTVMFGLTTAAIWSLAIYVIVKIH